MASNPQQQQSSVFSPSHLVWFHLLDAATGLSYKGTTADYVFLPPGSVIAQFRDAVKAKYDQPNYLKDIPSGTLIVYKNKAAFDKRNADEGKEDPLEEDSFIKNLGITEEDALIVAVPSPTSYLKLDQLEQEIKALENSENFKTLSSKNRAWAVSKPTEEEKGEWQILNEKLADLKKKKDFYQNAILSTNAHSVKKSDKTRKEYTKGTAIKDERLLLSDVAIKMWGRFRFLRRFGQATFEDFQWAAGFKNEDDVHDYFRKKANGEVQEDKIKESFTEKQWIWLIRLDQRVNQLLHDTLFTNQDGSLRLVLEHDVYQDGVEMAEEIVRTVYGSSKKVDIKDASGDW